MVRSSGGATERRRRGRRPGRLGAGGDLGGGGLRWAGARPRLDRQGPGRRLAVLARQSLPARPGADRIDLVRADHRPRYAVEAAAARHSRQHPVDRKSTRLNSSHLVISYAVFCLKKKKKKIFLFYYKKKKKKKKKKLQT